MARTRPTLADRYRRLLVTYPRGYRRERGQEIVDTLLDLAPPHRTRPTRRETVNLVCGGLRCRLGRPASRAVVAWAALTTLVCALFAAAFGSWVGWQTARPLPDRGTAAGLFSEALGTPQSAAGVHVSPALFVIYDHPLGPDTLRSLVFADGGEYQQGAAYLILDGRPEVSHEDTLGSIAQRLRARHWRVSGATIRPDCPGCGTAAMRGLLAARRGDDVLEFEVFLGDPRVLTPKPGDYPFETYLSVRLIRATPWAAYPLAVAGGLLGAAGAWLLFGWASRRTDGRGLPLRVATTILCGLTLLLWWLPIGLAFPDTLEHHVAETHFSWHPMWEWLGEPSGMPLFLLGALTALLALGLAAGRVPRSRCRRSSPRSTRPARTAGTSPAC